ncbi:REP-associated tyrosine transposase [Guyparkeria sp. TX1]|uniref:REP-associated tyrosine transposase n=1 Tax=Guyparkeria sp. TX1 TaxID=3115001 RepID=UPI003977B1C9
MSYTDLLRGRYSEPGREYLITAVTDKRKPDLESFDVARLLIQVFRASHETAQAEWLAFVVMPDHFHALLRLRQMSLPAVMRSVRGSSARRINGSLGRTGRLWQPGYHDRALRSEENRVAVARYIVANPLRAGLAERLADYPHWDAIWL